MSKSERSSLVEESLEAVGPKRLIDHYPCSSRAACSSVWPALSAYQPSILLMDEPFASVEVQTGGDLEDLVLQVQEEYGVTILFATHGIDEAVCMADRVGVLTHTPTTVLEILPITIPSPREQTKELPEFTHVRARVHRLVKGDEIAKPDPERIASGGERFDG